MDLFSEGHTLICCDFEECKYIKKHQLYNGKPVANRGKKHINVCGRKYLSLYFAHLGEEQVDGRFSPPLCCDAYEHLGKRWR